MSRSPESVLVAGGDSFIGKALIAEHRSNGDRVYWTTRRAVLSTEGTFLDLQSVPPDWTPPAEIQVAYLCAAVARVEVCEHHPALSYAINVEGTLRVAQALIECNAFVVLLSTNYVFADAKPRYSVDDPHSPLTQYGRQKAEAETRLMNLDGGTAIARLTKVLAGTSPLIAGWRAALQRGERISAFNDVYIAPISLEFATESLHRIGSSKRPGIYHLSGRDDLTYAALAKALAERLGFSTEAVEERSHRDAGVAIAAPRHGSLDMGGSSAQLGIRPQRAQEVVEDLIA